MNILDSIKKISGNNPDLTYSIIDSLTNGIGREMTSKEQDKERLSTIAVGQFNKVTSGILGGKLGELIEKNYLVKSYYDFAKDNIKTVPMVSGGQLKLPKFKFTPPKILLPVSKLIPNQLLEFVAPKMEYLERFKFKMPKLTIPKISAFGRMSNPLGIIVGGYGGLGLDLLYKKLNGDPINKDEVIKRLKKATGASIGGLIGFGVGTALFGPIGGMLLSTVGGMAGDLISKGIDKASDFLYSKGSAAKAGIGRFAADKYNSLYQTMSTMRDPLFPLNLYNFPFPSLLTHAIGIPRVPYDNYPALLHEGESVLTKRETNNLRNGMASISIAKLSDTIIVREDADIDRIANTLVSRIKQTAINMA
ncbi:MAG: hypothetical protein APF84_05800 [Gracilibacter sp. BRH_c7a]|nr:MAG: hypothetical protein APF84_05800 [Gracilibacter sp. BRH_c7a]